MLIYGICAMVLSGASWTIFGYVMGKAPKQGIKVSWLLVCTTLAAALVSVIVGCVQGFPDTTARGMLIAFGSLFLCGLFNYAQLDLISRSMQVGPNGIIWSIVQSGFIFPFFMGVLFFGVPLTWLRSAGLLCMLVALVLLGAAKNPGQGNASGGRWKLLAFSAFLVTGASQSLSNLPSYFPEANAVGSTWRTAAFTLGMCAAGLVAGLASGKAAAADFIRHLRSGPVWLNVALLEIPEIAVSYLFLYPGMDILSKAGIGSVAYPVMVGSCIIAFELFALIVLREKRKFAQWLALALCLAGAAAICL
ncbi:MAG: hypothetical protein IJS14_08305 [Lentisphaeria bacterium]|nr:hypothetical protein [Lentisphaeria bacterium]